MNITDEVKQADIIMIDGNPSLLVCLGERERFRGEKVAWYSMRQKKMVVGTINQVKKGGIVRYKS